MRRRVSNMPVQASARRSRLAGRLVGLTGPGSTNDDLRWLPLHPFDLLVATSMQVAIRSKFTANSIKFSRINLEESPGGLTHVFKSFLFAPWALGRQEIAHPAHSSTLSGGGVALNPSPTVFFHGTKFLKGVEEFLERGFSGC